MKRIPTLIVTLVCVFAAYSQNTVYIWKDNTLSVQAADSITVDRSFGNWVDLGLSVFWNKQRATYKGISWNFADKEYGSLSDGSRLPTMMEFRELEKRCTYRWDNDYGYYTGITGNTIVLQSSLYYWIDASYYYWKDGYFYRDQNAYAHVWLVRE